MKIKSITGVTEAENIRIQDNVAALLLTKNDAFGTEKISIKIAQAGQEDIHICVNTAITRLGEIAAQGEGFIQAFKTGGKEHMYIPIGIDGGFQFDKNKELVIELKGLTSGKAYEICNIGGYQISNKVFKYERGTVNNGDSSKNVSLIGVMSAWVRDISNLDSIKLNLAKHSLDLSRMELQSLNNLMNDIVMSTPSVTDTDATSGDIVKLGFINLLGIPHTPYAHSVTIVTDGGADVEYFLKKGIQIN